MNICIRNRQASGLSLQARSKLLNVVLVESVAVEVKTEKKGVNLTLSLVEHVFCMVDAIVQARTS